MPPVPGMFAYVSILKWFKGFKILAHAIILDYFTQIIMLSCWKGDYLFENFSFLCAGNRLHCSVGVKISTLKKFSVIFFWGHAGGRHGAMCAVSGHFRTMFRFRMHSLGEIALVWKSVQIVLSNFNYTWKDSVEFWFFRQQVRSNTLP